MTRGVYAHGPEEPTDVDLALAQVVRVFGVVSGTLAGVVHDLDGVVLAPRPPCRRTLAPERIVTVEGFRCTDGLQTLIDLAAELDDAHWEQALESALRKGLVTLERVEAALPDLGQKRVAGASRIRRVLLRRPAGAPPTESLLETMMVQLARTVPGLGDPARQLVVMNAYGEFVARVDLAWPEVGIFIELDGQHHKGQPVYDARRETAVVAATGWLCGRFTWREVADLPSTTARRLANVAEQGRRRPPAA